MQDIIKVIDTESPNYRRVAIGAGITREHVVIKPTDTIAKYEGAAPSRVSIGVTIGLSQDAMEQLREALGIEVRYNSKRQGHGRMAVRYALKSLAHDWDFYPQIIAVLVKHECRYQGIAKNNHVKRAAKYQEAVNAARAEWKESGPAMIDRALVGMNHELQRIVEDTNERWDEWLLKLVGSTDINPEFFDEAEDETSKSITAALKEAERAFEQAKARVSELKQERLEWRRDAVLASIEEEREYSSESVEQLRKIREEHRGQSNGRSRAFGH